MEESSNKQPPRCPCGFWGSTQTLGLCSKCYCEAVENETQGNLHNGDSGKPPVGHCLNQVRNRSVQTSSRMDSKHFPSHSTTDNLPSSLSSPGERSALATAAPPPHSSSVDAATVATSSANPVPHLQAGIGTATTSDINDMTSIGGSADGSRSCPSQHVISASTSSSETSQSSTSSDLSYNPHKDKDSCSVVSSSSAVSVVSSLAVSYPSSTSSTSMSSITCEDSVVSDTNSSTDGISSSTGLGKSRQSSNSPVSPQNVMTATSSSFESKTNSAEKIVSELSSIKDNSVKVEEVKSASENATVSQNSSTVDRKSMQKESDLLESPAKKGVKRSRDDLEGSNEISVASPSPQKNKKRCFTCSCKLELAQRTIGRCRCDRVFCALHRLPELHDCDFNHKEDARREAREKMIKPTRHLGPSFRREDHS